MRMAALFTARPSAVPGTFQQTLSFGAAGAPPPSRLQSHSCASLQPFYAPTVFCLDVSTAYCCLSIIAAGPAGFRSRLRLHSRRNQLARIRCWLCLRQHTPHPSNLIGGIAKTGVYGRFGVQAFPQKRPCTDLAIPQQLVGPTQNSHRDSSVPLLTIWSSYFSGRENSPDPEPVHTFAAGLLRCRRGLRRLRPPRDGAAAPGLQG